MVVKKKVLTEAEVLKLAEEISSKYDQVRLNMESNPHAVKVNLDMKQLRFLLNTMDGGSFTDEESDKVKDIRKLVDKYHNV